MNIMQTAKDGLVSLGPENPIVRLALRLYGMSSGFRVNFSGERITIAWKEKRIVLSSTAPYLVPIRMEAFGFCFSTTERRSQTAF